MQICPNCKSKQIITKEIKETDLNNFIKGEPVDFPNKNDKTIKIIQCDTCKYFEY